MADFNKIRLEETYRAKVQRRLGQTAAKQSQILTFLNTNFGLFLLSTVFISCFSWTFNEWTTYTKNLAEAKRTREKLALEIMNRVKYLDMMDQTFPYSERKVVETALNGFDPKGNVNPSWIHHYSPVFPEYEERSLISLIWELETVSTKSFRQKLKTAREPVGKAGTFFEKLEYKKVLTPGKNPEGELETFSLNAKDKEQFDHDVLKPLAFLKDSSTFEAQ
jgi:hypothetical protein